jgi:hypothetical protein
MCKSITIKKMITLSFKNIAFLVGGFILLCYIIKCYHDENIVLKCKIDRLTSGESDTMKASKEEPPENNPKKSRELYSKINSIVQNKLGISVRDLVLGT